MLKDGVAVAGIGESVGEGEGVVEIGVRVITAVAVFGTGDRLVGVAVGGNVETRVGV